MFFFSECWSCLYYSFPLFVCLFFLASTFSLTVAFGFIDSTVFPLIDFILPPIMLRQLSGTSLGQNRLVCIGFGNFYFGGHFYIMSSKRERGG